MTTKDVEWLFHEHNHLMCEFATKEIKPKFSGKTLEFLEQHWDEVLTGLHDLALLNKEDQNFSIREVIEILSGNK